MPVRMGAVLCVLASPCLPRVCRRGGQPWTAAAATAAAAVAGSLPGQRCWGFAGRPFGGREGDPPCSPKQHVLESTYCEMLVSSSSDVIRTENDCYEYRAVFVVLSCCPARA